MEVLLTSEIETIDGKKTELQHAEQAIERAARNAFQEWGAQLKHIRDGKLYVFRSPTWEEYCNERWDMTPQRAGQLISSFEQLKKIESFFSESENIFSPPIREGHIKPLSRLADPKQQAEVWQRVTASANGKGITAKIVEAEVVRYQSELKKDWITLEEWEAMPADDQNRVITQPYVNDTKFNKTNDNIEWARWSWNPVTGCLHNCAYCYARDIADRFYAQGFAPSFLPSRLTAPINTKQPDFDTITDPVERLGQRNVFVCSMADLFGKWVPVDWINAVLDTVRRNPQWTFLFLTKFPIRMAEFEYPDNCWLGTSVDYQWAVDRAEKAFSKIKASGFNGTCWLSCEPMMENLQFNSLEMFDWVVMGGSSKSTQTPEFKPPFDWILDLYHQARTADCKVYMKTNLLGERVREYPE